MTLLQTQNLSAFYGDFQALFDINVTVEQGETVAVIGANGAGKTTFLRALAGSASLWSRRDASCFRACR
jgi:branched-chain amino acid transport system ATP-binding protein